jgi:hypothetical protein
MAKSSLHLPVLANNPKDRLSYIRETVEEMNDQVQVLRKRKVGAVPVESEAVDSLYQLIRRMRGDLARLGLCL